jgi:uncharacterized Ntn-hydrolase superfamily protein
MINPHDLYTTYSIVARDPATGQLGVAVQTHQMTVGERIVWLKPGVGALITQSMANISYGPMGIAMLAEGILPEQVIAGLTATDPDAHRRQVGVVDAKGHAASFTGSGCIREAAHHAEENLAVQANMMTNPTVVPAMVAAYKGASGTLAQRLMAALVAAQAEGGDIRGMQSAAIKVVPGEVGTPDWQTVVDLRVDEHADPVTELARLVRLKHANSLDEQGYAALEAGDMDRALTIWAEVTATAPEMEELPYWQALTLADEHNAIAPAAAILRAMLESDAPRRDHWLDLVGRLVECGILEHPDRIDALLAAVKADD